MSITSYTQTLLGDGQVVRVNVTSDLAAPVGFHWYLDGVWVGSTAIGQFDLYLGGQGYLDVVDTEDLAFDPIASAPPSYPARRTLFWVRSVDAVIDYYRVEQKKGSGDWTVLGIVEGGGTDWTYTYVTPRLDDLSDYTWRIVPIAVGGMEGTAYTIGPERLVRIPDACNFSTTWNEEARTISILAAA